MTFWYLPRSIDTNFLLVYEPYRALEGLEGVGIKLPDFRANEIALLQFNLQDGIIDTFHTFIKPPNEAIPLGYGYEISKNADDTHGITLDDDPMYHQYR